MNKSPPIFLIRVSVTDATQSPHHLLPPMASKPLLLLLFFCSFICPSFSIFLPISKHPPTNQFSTWIRLGDPPSPFTLLLDLSGRSLWLHCASTAGTPVPSLSILCSTAGNAAHLPQASHLSPPCTLPLQNPISKLSGNGTLFSLDHFLLVCAPPFLLHGIAGGATGVFGLGRASRVAPLTQLSHQLNLPLKFSLCLPGNTGDGFILAGKSPDRSLLYTPFVDGSGSGSDYHIRVKSLKISNKKLSLPGSPFTAKISTVDPYTKLGRRIYPTFLKAFRIAAKAADMKEVEAKTPFGVCYVAGESIQKVPAIELVLQSEMVRWRIGGRNSMVDAGDGVVCLGVVEGGSEFGEDEMVLGAYQLEDVLMEFDVGGGMLGFGSLVEKGTTCSELGSYATGGSREVF